MEKKFYFQQLFEKESSTYTYLLADSDSKEAIIIDPVNLTLERDLRLIDELGLNLKYVLETHVHADHITSASRLREKLGAKIVVGKGSEVKKADILLEDGEKLNFGRFEVKALSTPGHTNGCSTYVVNDMLFTGDALLIRSVGRTDFQQGSSQKLYESIKKLYQFPDDTIIFPSHNYSGLSKSSIGEEKKYNAFAREEVSKEEFSDMMKRRNLPLPQKIKESVPANMNCGEEMI